MPANQIILILTPLGLALIHEYYNMKRHPDFPVLNTNIPWWWAYTVLVSGPSVGLPWAAKVKSLNCIGYFHPLVKGKVYPAYVMLGSIWMGYFLTHPNIGPY